MKKTIIKDLHVDAETGTIHVLMHKRVLDEQGNVISQGNHRTVLEPDTDIDAQAAAVNAHLAMMSEAQVSTDDWDLVKKHAEIARTPEIVKKWTDQKEARIAQEKIAQAQRDEAAAAARAEQEARFAKAVSDAVAALKPAAA